MALSGLDRGDHAVGAVEPPGLDDGVEVAARRQPPPAGPAAGRRPTRLVAASTTVVESGVDASTRPPGCGPSTSRGP